MRSAFLFAHIAKLTEHSSSKFLVQRVSPDTSHAWYNWRMFEASQHKKITVRVIRDGRPEPLDDEWIGSSPEERIEAVWSLTKLCLAWNNFVADEPRLQRTVTRIQRPRR